MMYPSFEELLRRISKLNISISILTNGMLISERNVRLFQNKNIAITISLDGGTKQDHEFLRGKKHF